MGFLDDLQNKASEMLGGAGDAASDAGSDLTSGVTDAGADLSNLSTDVQDQITQYAEEHNVSIEAAKEHVLGGGN